jgi:hypothetical protein
MAAWRTSRSRSLVDQAQNASPLLAAAEEGAGLGGEDGAR